MNSNKNQNNKNISLSRTRTQAMTGYLGWPIYATQSIKRGLRCFGIMKVGFPIFSQKCYPSVQKVDLFAGLLLAIVSRSC